MERTPNYTLQLQSNNLETRTFAVLAGAVSKSIQNLKTLELKWNDIEKDDKNLEDISFELEAERWQIISFGGRGRGRKGGGGHQGGRDAERTETA